MRRAIKPPKRKESDAVVEAKALIHAINKVTLDLMELEDLLTQLFKLEFGEDECF